MAKKLAIFESTVLKDIGRGAADFLYPINVEKLLSIEIDNNLQPLEEILWGPMYLLDIILFTLQFRSTRSA